MNLFLLDLNAAVCAQYHCDKHVIKMLLELVQMLYTAHICTNSSNLPINAYRKISNHNHPTAKWVRENRSNYKFTCELAIQLALEYTHRYNKIHSCEKHAIWLNQCVPDLPSGELSTIPLAMPDIYKTDDPVKSYRSYYKSKYFAQWTNRPVPKWFSFCDIRKYFRVSQK